MVAQNGLVPIRGSLDDKISQLYDAALKSSLLGGNWQLAYKVLPSFTPEYALVCNVTEKKLTLREADEQIYEIQLYYGTTQIDTSKIKVSKYEMIVDESLVQALDSLLSHVTKTSSDRNKTIGGFDGVSYYFFSRNYSGECWSPSSGSYAHRLVTFMDAVCSMVKQGDASQESALTEQARTLQESALLLNKASGTAKKRQGKRAKRRR
ncbi:MAG: hypothetical protein IJ808_08510 [Muribaculaceae bacterium]|nr:hypothetical protein [Muribaculaceae bacterium]